MRKHEKAWEQQEFARTKSHVDIDGVQTPYGVASVTSPSLSDGPTPGS